MLTNASDIGSYVTVKYVLSPKVVRYCPVKFKKGYYNISNSSISSIVD